MSSSSPADIRAAAVVSADEMASESSSPTSNQPSYERGWLWKRAIGKSVFGRRNWKMRFIESDPHSLRYYSNEPFDKAKGAVLWKNVVHVYEEPPLDFKSDVSDRPTFLFGLRFRSHETGQEMLLMFRTDDEEEHRHWVGHFQYMHEQFGDQDDEEGGDTMRSGVVERVSKKLRSLVSLQKMRYIEDGLDLDLAYILPNIIAMGFPCEGREELFRNPMSHVVKFFDKYHKRRFKVYNLCSERFYPPNRFAGSFERFPFDDHNPCPLQLLLLICENVFEYVSQGEGGALTGSDALAVTVKYSQMKDIPVAAIHCKAGKGRTGLVICAYIMYSGAFKTAQDAMTMFAARRTKDGKGIQIPSQKRYLEYFYTMLHSYNGAVPSATMTVSSLVLSHNPTAESDGSSQMFVRIEQRMKEHRHVPLGRTEGQVNDPLDVIVDTSEKGPLHRTVKGSTNVVLPIDTTLIGVSDFRIVLLHRYKAGNAIELCSFWLHTGFLVNNAITINKDMLDDAVKDKRNHRFPSSFRVTLNYTLDAPGPTIPPTGKPIPVCDR